MKSAQEKAEARRAALAQRREADAAAADARAAGDHPALRSAAKAWAQAETRLEQNGQYWGLPRPR